MSRLILVLFLLLITGCGTPAPTSQHASRLLMGTLITITVWAEPGNKTAEAMRAAFAEMARIEALMSSHRGDSAVSVINQGPRGNWLPLNPEVAQVVEEGLRVQARSAGAFDPGLWPLSRLWGFSRDPPATTPPAAGEIAAWLQERRQGESITIRDTATGRQIRLPNAAAGLDLGGIAKGYAVDRALETLTQQGVANAIVNAGGNLGLIGSKGDQPWRLGIQNPRDENSVAAELSLRGPMALVTSGDYERFFIHEGQRYHHILDPQRGEPSAAGLMSVTILHPSTMTADALSTAVFVLGRAKGLALVEQEKAEALLVLTDGSPVATPGFPGTWLGP